MRAVVYSRGGDSSVMQTVELASPPDPGHGEVRVRILVSGVNPTDWKGRESFDPRAESTSARRRVPHHDGAGVIDAIGQGVNRFSVGDRVWVYMAAHAHPWSGTAQELTVLPQQHVAPLPAGASLETGASLGVPAMTAHRALTTAESGPVRLAPGALDGRTVLVHGGAGAVGHAALQLARWAGATVISTVSTQRKRDLAAAAGAHHIVNYREGDPAAAILAYAPQGVDQIVEVAPSRNADIDTAILKNHGQIAVYAHDGGSLQLAPWRLLATNARLQFLLLYTVGSQALEAAAEDINLALEHGALSIGENAGLPVSRYRLEDTPVAHDAVQSGFVGKVLVDVEPRLGEGTEEAGD